MAAKPSEKPLVKPQVVINKPRPTLRQILPPPPPPPAPKPEVRKPAAPAALRAFEQAVKVFNRRQFEEAKELFETLLQKFPQEVEILSRSQMYLQVCHQKLTAAPVVPVRNVSADELYDRGVYALNVGDFAQARNFFEKALRLNPNEPHFLYSLAATYAQTGSHEQALDYLRRSIQIQPRFRSQAFDDADFSGLRENRHFQELLGLTSPFDLLEARR
ncbi:MAG: tetratricopeptide repeat protein [Acidobacteria bacterium]|nr:tetratricopeptide repeat protein [Acidobacteriota bacterium]